MTDESSVPDPEISKINLHCVVCSGELPPGRATSRSKFTCGRACRDTWKEVQKQHRKKRCNFCHAPSSPEERVMYRAFRKSLGAQMKGRGRPMPEEARGRQREYCEALKQAIALLTNGEKIIINVGYDWPEALEAIERFQNLVDGKGWVRRTLPESGDTAAAPEGDDDGVYTRQAMGAGIGLSERGEPDTVEHRGAADGSIAGDVDVDQLDRDAGAERECGDGAAERGDASGHIAGADTR